MLLWEIGPLGAAQKTLANLPAYQTFAAEWDQRDQQIRATLEQGANDLTVPPFSFDLAISGRLATLMHDAAARPNFNTGIAQYYGLKSIRAAASVYRWYRRSLSGIMGRSNCAVFSVKARW